MSGTLTPVVALLLGVVASTHCVLMCGGIMGALSMATRKRADGRPVTSLLLTYQLGRISSYALAAFALAGAGAWLVHALDAPSVRLALRLITAAAFALVALTVLGATRGLDARLGHRVWQRVAPLARRLLPVNTPLQALAIGALWGWMPCGLVYSALLVASLSMNPWHSALSMAMFGLGTMPAVLLSAKLTRGLFARLPQRALRSSTAIALLTLSLWTALGPWLATLGHGYWMAWLPMDCVTR